MSYKTQLIWKKYTAREFRDMITYLCSLPTPTTLFLRYVPWFGLKRPTEICYKHPGFPIFMYVLLLSCDIFWPNSNISNSVEPATIHGVKKNFLLPLKLAYGILLHDTCMLVTHYTAESQSEPASNIYQLDVFLKNTSKMAMLTR